MYLYGFKTCLIYTTLDIILFVYPTFSKNKLFADIIAQLFQVLHKYNSSIYPLYEG